MRRGLLRVEVAQLDVEDPRDVRGSPFLVAGNVLMVTTSAPASRSRSRISTRSASSVVRTLDARTARCPRRDGQVGQVRRRARRLGVLMAPHYGTAVDRRGVPGRRGPPTAEAPGTPIRRSAMYRQATMTATTASATRQPRQLPQRAPATIRVGIVGAAGYVGGELIRLLERHPTSASPACRAATATTSPSALTPAPRAHRPPHRGRAARRSTRSSWPSPTALRRRSCRASWSAACASSTSGPTIG